MSGDFKFELLENGLDFILSGLNYLSEQKDKSDLKYGVLHICSGIELILKERLKSEHWSLIFSNVDNADEELLKLGEFKSVDYMTSIKRLENICNISIKKDHERHLVDFRNRRNKLQHFGINDSWEASVSSSVIVVSVILDFISNELEPDNFELDNKRLLNRIKRKLSEFHEYVEKRLKLIDKDIKSAEALGSSLIECPICFQFTLVLGDGDPHCLFCNYKEEPIVAAKNWIGTHMGINEYMTVKDGGEYPLYQCPECDSEALIYLERYAENAYICFSCGNDWSYNSLDNCMKCNGLFFQVDEEPPFCSDCYKEMLSKE